MPHRGNPDQKGQLYVILEVDMPDEGWLASIDQKACDFPFLILRSSPPEDLDIDATSNTILKTDILPIFYSLQALEAILPPKREEMNPKPAVIDEVPFEEGDIVDVRETPFAGSNFFDHGFGTQFGDDDEGDWEDEEDEDDEDEMGEPECRPQ